MEAFEAFHSNFLIELICLNNSYENTEIRTYFNQIHTGNKKGSVKPQRFILKKSKYKILVQL